jgi:2-phosphoglycerate kinase
VSKEKNIILIAGAPTVGKSTIARRLSERLKLPWISTDQIREIMWGCADVAKFPNLFNTHNQTAEEFYSTYSASEVVHREIEQGEEVWKGVLHFIENDYTWSNGCIIEGVAILPHLYAKDFKNSTHVRLIILVDKHPERIRDVVFKRGLWSGAARYTDSVKEKEVDYVVLFNEWFECQAQEFNLPVAYLNKTDGDIAEIVKILG